MYFIARVAINVPLEQLFDYIIPEEYSNQYLLGRRVIIPFGNKNRLEIGIIFETYQTQNLDHDFEIKPLQSIDFKTNSIDSDLLKVIQEASIYYHYFVGRIAILCLSGKLRTTKPLSKNLLKWLDQYKNQNYCHFNYKKNYELNPDQVHAIQTISNQLDQYRIFMLYGITGSGKTEVYLNLIYEVLHKKQHAQILILVPEIILTPQLEDYLRNRFTVESKSFIVSLHSGLSENERFQNHYLASSGIAKIILGTRSAIFTPLPYLQMIIIDEEHDLSYRQQDDLRYSARDIAILRARAKKIPLILGSATPSLETWQNVLDQRYQRLDLKYKAIPNVKSSNIHLVDIRPLKMKDGLSDIAILKIKEAIQLNQQTLIFINRRGYAPVIYCKECAWVATCPFCSASKLVIHQKQNRLICHHCGYQEDIKTICPNCQCENSLVPVGQGTERIEDYLKILFPNDEIVRLDADHIKNREDWLNIREKIKNNLAKIIIGTQMATKGHDFKHISTVIIVNADSGLYSTDFRSEEYLLGQLIQVIGRCGRNQLESHVYIQTSFPTHPLFGALLRQNYLHYAEKILEQRQLFGYPPFSKQAILRAISVNKEQVYEFLQHIYNKSIKLFENQKCNILFDPIPAKMERKAGKTQAYLLIQSINSQELHKHLKLIKSIINTLKLPYTLKWFIEINPIEF